MTALYSSGPTASSFSQPGMAVATVLGSRSAAHTRSRGTGISFEPSIFICSPHGFDGAERMAPQPQAGHAGIAHRRVAPGIVEPDEGGLETIPTIDRRPTGVVAHEADRESGERYAQRDGAAEVRAQGGLAMPPSLVRRSPPCSLSDRKAQDLGAAPPRVWAQDRLALPSARQADHEIRIQKLDLPPLEGSPELPADQPAGVHQHPLEPQGRCPVRHAPRPWGSSGCWWTPAGWS